MTRQPLANNTILSEKTTDLERQPRIGIVIASLEPGGAERMALALLRALLAKGQTAYLFCLGNEHSMPIPGNADEQERIRSAIVTLGLGHSKQSTLRKALAFPTLHRRLERNIEQNQLDLVISFMERANILNLLGGAKVPRMISIRKHLSMALKDKSPLKRNLVKLGYRYLLKQAHNINFNSHEAAEDFKQLFPKLKVPLSVIHNFVDTDMQEKAKQSPGAEAETILSGPTVLTCGRLMPVKGQIALLRAFARVAKTVPNSKLVIVGDGPLREQLDHMRRELKLEHRVTLAGFQSNPFAWVSRCELFVLSSRAEGFPNALLEAMALGRPVIATDCHSGPRELLAPDSDPCIKTDTVQQAPYGILTQPLQRQDRSASEPLTSAEAALAEAIQRLLSDTSLRQHYAGQARQRAQAFQPQAILKQWQHVLGDYSPAKTNH